MNMMNEMKAADLISPRHPLHKSLVGWMRAKGLDVDADPSLVSKRQARKFLSAHPHYSAVQRAA